MTQDIAAFLREKDFKPGTRLSADDEAAMFSRFLGCCNSLSIQEAIKIGNDILVNYYRNVFAPGKPWPHLDESLKELFYALDDATGQFRRLKITTSQEVNRLMTYDGTNRLYRDIFNKAPVNPDIAIIITRFMLIFDKYADFKDDEALFNMMSKKAKELRDYVMDEKDPSRKYKSLDAYDMFIVRMFWVFERPFDFALENGDYLPLLDEPNLMGGPNSDYSAPLIELDKDISPLLVQLSTDTLFENPQYIIPYCRYVLKGRWYDMEPILKEIDPQVYELYMAHVEAGKF